MHEPTVGEQLATISVKLDLLLAGRDDHEARLRVLESSSEPAGERAKRDERIDTLRQFQWKTAGASGVLSSGLVVALLKLFHG